MRYDSIATRAGQCKWIGSLASSAWHLYLLAIIMSITIRSGLVVSKDCWFHLGYSQFPRLSSLNYEAIYRRHRLSVRAIASGRLKSQVDNDGRLLAGIAMPADFDAAQMYQSNWPLCWMQYRRVISGPSSFREMRMASRGESRQCWPSERGKSKSVNILCIAKYSARRLQWHRIS